MSSNRSVTLAVMLSAPRTNGRLPERITNVEPSINDTRIFTCRAVTPGSGATALVRHKYKPRRELPQSEDLLTPGEDLVQRVGEKRRGLGQVIAHLLVVLLPAFLDLLFERLLQVALLERSLPFVRLIDDHVGHQRSRQPPRLLAGVLGQEGIDGLRGPGGRRRRRSCGRCRGGAGAQGGWGRGWRRRHARSWGSRSRWCDRCRRAGRRGRRGRRGLRQGRWDRRRGSGGPVLRAPEGDHVGADGASRPSTRLGGLGGVYAKDRLTGGAPDVHGLVSFPSWSPASRRRSNTKTDPGRVLAYLFISVANSL